MYLQEKPKLTRCADTQALQFSSAVFSTTRSLQQKNDFQYAMATELYMNALNENTPRIFGGVLFIQTKNFERRGGQLTPTADQAAATARYCADALPYKSLAAESVAVRAAA